MCGVCGEGGRGRDAARSRQGLSRLFLPVLCCCCGSQITTRQEQGKARQGNERDTLAAGPGDARWVCVGKAGSRSLGAWRPGSGIGKAGGCCAGAPCARPLGMRCIAGDKKLCRVQSPEPSARESSAVQCGPVQQHTALPRLQRVAEHGGWCVFGCTRTVSMAGLANRRPGERSPTGVLRCQGPGVRAKWEGREAKGTSRYGTEHRCTQRLARPDRARCRS